MENDQRLTPLPLGVTDLHPTTAHADYPSAYTTYGDSLESKRSIRQYFNVIYKRLPIIVAIAVLVTAAAALYSFRQPSRYQAQTQLIIEPRKPQVTQKDAININFGDDQKYYNTQLQLLQNQDLMKRVVIALGLHREAGAINENPGIIAGLRSLFGGSQKAPNRENTLPVVSEVPAEGEKNGEIQLTDVERERADKYSAILASGLKVEQIERTNIVVITLETTERLLAPMVTDKVAELFIQEDIKRETAGAEKAYQDLGESIEDLKATIIQQENALIAEMKSADLPLQEKGGELRASNLEGLWGQLREAQVESGKIQAIYNAAVAASGKGDILAVVGDNQAIQDARRENLRRQGDLEKRIDEIDKKLDEKRQKKQELLAIYTPAHNKVITVEAEITELEAQKTRINKEVSDKIKSEGETLIKNAEREVLASLRSQLAAAQQREARQQSLFDQAAAQANVEGQAETTITGMKREIESNRSLLDTYIQRQKEQELALATGRPNNIKIQNNAVTPVSPIGPQRARNILIAMLLSLAAGVGLAFLLDYLDDSVRTSDDISRHLGLPTLALIPHYLQAGADKRKLLPSKIDPSSPSPAALITMQDGRSPMAEAYRHLRTSLLFSSAGKPPQTILITSSQPSEGKTTTAINTAITLAQADTDVVVVDCDLRRPRLHTHFGLSNDHGLTNYLSGDRNTEGLIRTYDELPRLKIITSGPIPPNPTELLSSNEMRNLLQFLSGRFKHVIVDTPPAISFTDAAILSTLVDGVVLVAMANKSSIHLMRQFKHRIHNIGARIYGVVLNGLRSGSAEYEYYGTGYYKYYSQANDDSTPRMEVQSEKAER